jgi:murein DD-endopeptidase MepM/ murein hydrolase activator NlpD
MMNPMRARRILGSLAGALGVAVLAYTGVLERLVVLSPSPSTAPAALTPPPELPAPGPSAAGDPAVRVESVTVRRGDNLVRALVRQGVGAGVGASIAAALIEGGADLKRVKPRDTLEITWDLHGEPIAVRYEPSPWLGFAAVATDAGWEVRRSETRPDVRVEAVAGEVSRSLFHAIDGAGESPQLVLDFVEIFQSDFDFTADTRPGDRFRLLVEKRYAGDAFVDYGRILAAQYLSDGAILTGVGHERDQGFGYYDPDGRSLRKSFLKSPLEFSRITSGFTYARPHPILGGTRPHLAIDYAAPVGTPVRAVAAGLVVAAGWKGGNGISVTLRHRSGYETMYNHLSRLARGIRAGLRVDQRDVIGYVGSTGLSTGPHLDYRVSRNGTFVNPLSEKFLPGEPIAAPERAEFLARARDLIRRLEAAAPF